MMTTKLKSFLVLLAMLVGTVNDVWADASYDFTNYANNTAITGGNVVNNSSGDAITIISVGNGSNNISTNQQIAVTGYLGYQNPTTLEFGWFIYNNGLECRNTSNKLSILNLFQGDKVKITFEVTFGTRSSSIRSNNVAEGSGTTIQSGVEYTMSGDGSFDINVGQYMNIKKIEITSGTSNRIAFDYSSSTESRTYNNVTLPFYRCRLSSRNFTEPSLSVYPSNATVTYSIQTIEETDDKRPAILKNTSSHEVMMLNQGICKVTATANGQSVSYYLEIYDDVASYSITSITKGKKYQLTGPGRIHNRTISEVPGVLMTFSVTESGSAPNTTVVYQEGDHYVAFTNDDDGWWDRRPTNNHTSPEQGTFYAFRATASGKLRFGGIKQNPTNSAYNPGMVYLVKIDPATGYPQDTIFTNGQNNYLDSKDITPGNYVNSNFTILAGDRENDVDGYIQLETGWTYYLQGEANNEVSPNKYSPFLLEWFSYELDNDLYLDRQYAVSSQTGYQIGYNGTYTADDVNVSGVNISIGTAECTGTVKSASVSIVNGHLMFSNIIFKDSLNNDLLSSNTVNKDKMGGAIKVGLTAGSNHIDFTLTIPYGKHVWDFRQTAHQSPTNRGDWSYNETQLATKMKSHTSYDWKLVWKVQSTSQQQLRDPILSVNNSINGDNAFCMENTAGLIFITGPRSIGALDTRNLANTGYAERDTMTANGTTTADILMMKGDATIFFPGVTENQYIKIYTYRHSINKGENFYARNLVDLDGKPYNNTSADNYFKLFGATYETSDRYAGDGITGAAIFRVPNGYVATNDLSAIPSLTLCDDGWVKIYRIEIMDEFKPDLFMPLDISSNNQGTDKNNGGYLGYDSPASSVVLKKKGNTVTPATKYYWAAPGWVGTQHGNTCRYEVVPTNVSISSICDQTPDKPGYNRLAITYNNGNGHVRIIQREVVNKAGSCVTSTVGPVNSATDYVIDKNEYRISVGELTVQDYPYTWDFTSYHMNKDNAWTNGTSASKIAIGGSSGATYSNWTTGQDSYTLNIGNEVNMGSNDVGAYSNDNSKTDPYQNLSITVPAYTQGADLKAGTTKLAEYEGLGISLPIILKDYQTDATHYTRNCKAFDVTKSVTTDGNTLSFAGELTIPEVDNGMYIFVQASKNPQYKKVVIEDNKEKVVTVVGIRAADETSLYGIGGTDSDIFSVRPGVYLYQNTTGTKQDIIVSFDGGAEVQTIAVTDITKGLDKFGCATESRDRAIDHTYEGTLTNNDVNAYIITTADEYGTPYDYKGYPMVKKTHITADIVPANVGVVLCKDNHSGDPFTSPLFVPAVNNMPAYDEANSDFWKSNWMIPNVYSKQHDSEETAMSDEAMISIKTLPYHDPNNNSADWNVGKKDENGNYISYETIYGSYSSLAERYVDLSGYKELRIYQVANEDVVRCFFYGNGSPADGVTKYPTPVYDNNNNLLYYMVNLQEIYNECHQVKLIGIKGHQYGVSATVTAIKAISYANTTDAPCTKFIMSPNYFVYYKNTGGTSTQQNALVESFYRMRLYHGTEEEEAKYNTLAANKALLLIPSGKLPTALWNGGNGLARQGVIYMDLQDIEDAETTGVDAPVADATSDEQAVYYTLSGNRTNGKPTKKGIYVSNGKKVCVK